MENIDFTRMSSKGQVVLPKKIRNLLKLREGEVFMIFGENDMLILKRIKKPDLQEFKKLAAKSQKIARQKGLKKKDIDIAVTSVRHARRS